MFRFGEKVQCKTLLNSNNLFAVPQQLKWSDTANVTAKGNLLPTPPKKLVMAISFRYCLCLIQNSTAKKGCYFHHKKVNDGHFSGGVIMLVPACTFL
jgi:hypothetical protein